MSLASLLKVSSSSLVVADSLFGERGPFLAVHSLYLILSDIVSEAAGYVVCSTFRFISGATLDDRYTEFKNLVSSIASEHRTRSVSVPLPAAVLDVHLILLHQIDSLSLSFLRFFKPNSSRRVTQ